MSECTRESFAADTLRASASCPSFRKRLALAVRTAVTNEASLPVRTADDSSSWRLTRDGKRAYRARRSSFAVSRRHSRSRETRSEDRFYYTEPLWPRTGSRIRRVDPSTESRFSGSQLQIAKSSTGPAITSLDFGARLAVVSSSQGRLPSPSSHRTGLVGLTSGSSGRRGRRNARHLVRRRHRCPQLFQRQRQLRWSDNMVHVAVQVLK
jgi:hypothetical protein